MSYATDLIEDGASGILTLHGKHYVIFEGHQAGVWTKYRWARRDLRRRQHPTRLARLLAAHAEAEEQARAGDAAAERLTGPWGPPGSDRRRP